VVRIKSGVKGFFKNPLIFGAGAGLLVILFNVSIASLAEGSLKGGYSIFLDNGIFAYIVPLAVGVQMGLFRYHRNLTSLKKLCNPEKIGITGSVSSSATMVLCCVHHISDLMPAAGFALAASSFLGRYKDAFIIIGLLANLTGSIYIAKAILRDRSNT
jgi:hypothetical protein